MGVLILLLTLAACTAPSVHFENHIALPQGQTPIPNASYAEIAGDPNRLTDDVTRAVEHSDWGLVRINTTGITLGTLGIPEPHPANGPPLIVHADVILPDGRDATITAWSTDQPNRLALAIRVGPFGTPEVEQAFARELAKVLAGKPKPQRGGSFVLPE